MTIFFFFFFFMDRKDYQREYYLVHRKLKSEKMTNQINRPKKYKPYSQQEEIKMEPIIVIKKPKKTNKKINLSSSE